MTYTSCYSRDACSFDIVGNSGNSPQSFDVNLIEGQCKVSNTSGTTFLGTENVYLARNL